jgi:hypothetical protein
MVKANILEACWEGNEYLFHEGRYRYKFAGCGLFRFMKYLSGMITINSTISANKKRGSSEQARL